MALDLSTVSEPLFYIGESDVPPEYVLLPADCISTSGSGDVLFRISALGQLILADFSMELHNGCYVLRRHPHQSECAAEYSEVPTNLSLEKCQWTSDDRSQCNMWPSYVSELADKMPPSFRAPMKVQEPEYCIYPSDPHDCLTQNLNPTDRHISLGSGNSDNLIPSGSFLSTSEEPVDATLPRPPPSSSNDVTDLTTSLEQKRTVPDADLSILSQSVRHLLQAHGHHFTQDNPEQSGLTDDIVLSGHNLSSLARFAKQLTQHRLRTGLSQLQMSQELGKHFNSETMFSQSLLSRFERLDVTVRAAFRLLPYLETWLAHTKQECTVVNSNDGVVSGSLRSTTRRPRLLRLLRSGLTLSTTHDLSKLTTSSVESVSGPSEPSRAQATERLSKNYTSNSVCHLKNPHSRPERRKRTHFSDSVLITLMQAYEKNPRPKVSLLQVLNSHESLWRQDKIENRFAFGFVIGVR
ncbi:unnamed protein product [Dicrocoelium dendriticum]|nr:unnamed protein product [Dicrocoelium dendriticum]